MAEQHQHKHNPSVLKVFAINGAVRENALEETIAHTEAVIPKLIELNADPTLEVTLREVVKARAKAEVRKVKENLEEIPPQAVKSINLQRVLHHLAFPMLAFVLTSSKASVRICKTANTGTLHHAFTSKEEHASLERNVFINMVSRELHQPPPMTKTKLMAKRRRRKRNPRRRRNQILKRRSLKPKRRRSRRRKLILHVLFPFVLWRCNWPPT